MYEAPFSRTSLCQISLLFSGSMEWKVSNTPSQKLLSLGNLSQSLLVLRNQLSSIRSLELRDLLEGARVEGVSEVWGVGGPGGERVPGQCLPPGWWRNLPEPKVTESLFPREYSPLPLSFLCQLQLLPLEAGSFAQGKDHESGVPGPHSETFGWFTAQD